MRLIWMAAGLALISAAGVHAADKDQEKQDKPKKEKMVCRSEKITGSRTRVNRICMTQKEWDELAANSKAWLDDQQRGAAGGTNSSWDPSKAPGAP